VSNADISLIFCVGVSPLTLVTFLVATSQILPLIAPLSESARGG